MWAGLGGGLHPGAGQPAGVSEDSWGWAEQESSSAV